MPWFRYVFYVLVVVSCISSTYLYNYASIKDCSFPSPKPQGNTINHQQHAPFRLLALGDPQLEGDTSIEQIPHDSYRLSKLRANLRYTRDVPGVLREAVDDLFRYGIPITIRALRKRIDLIGNDYYLAHIYRTLYRQTNPTHVTVLGDLLGSQWINDAEFGRRAGRYWNRVFKDALRVEDSITEEPTIEVLDEDQQWRRRIINIAGNHDIGYAGDLTKERMTRFERSFGAANWEIVFQVPGQDEDSAYLRLIILNSMILDTPALDEDLQRQTYEFLNDVITRSEPVENRSVGTVLLTHIPLHKKEGICVDAPYFSFGHGGRLSEQNHLSAHVSRSLLEGIFGMSGNSEAPFRGLGRKGLILNGHDHEGCDVWHHLPRTLPEEDSDTREWNATRYTESPRDRDIPGIREVTLRSMMGEYGGWGYLVSAWVDPITKEWTFEVNRCSAGIQHIWWAVHILILITAGSGSLLVLLLTLTQPRRPDSTPGSSKAHRKVPSITLLPPEDDDSARPVTPIPRPPSPFDHFDGTKQISGGRARRRRPT